MKYFLMSLLSLLTLSAVAQKEIDIADVANHVGDSVKICSKIYGGKYLEQTKGSPTFLNVGGNYPDAPFTLVIWNDVRKQFKYMPEDILKGKDVCIYGKIILYKNKPEIVISNPNQIPIN